MSKGKPEVFPNVTVDHDTEKYHVEIELPGVRKEDIQLDVGDQSFCIKAPTEEIVYSACYTLAHMVNAKKADAIFNNGLLKLALPFKSKIGGTRIVIK